MKISNFAYFLLLVLGFTSLHFTLPKNDKAILLQKSLEQEIFSLVLDKDDTGQLLPLTLVSDYAFSEEAPIKIMEQPVRLVNTEDFNALNLSHSVLFLDGIKIKEHKATLWFTYGKKTIKIKLVYQEEAWVFRAATSKGAGTFNTMVEF